MIDYRANTSILLLMSAFVLVMGCGIATGITFYVFIDNKCGGADLDKSCDVSFTDFAILAQYWVEPNCSGSNDCGGADLVYNNAIDIADLSLFAQNWLCELSRIINVDLAINNLWMYQNLPGAASSNLIANVAVTVDPLSNSSYSYQWEFVLPSDVNIPPRTVLGGEANVAFCTFAAPDCNEPNGISDSGQVFTVKVTVTGDDHGNTGSAQAEFGIALLGDVNNDCIVNVVDRAIVTSFWRGVPVGACYLRDCDLNCDGRVNVIDRSIVTAIWRGTLCQNDVNEPCPYRSPCP